ncbi:hypothetical protein DITRI_Ditri07aG0037900 [Diplodiscus trichospermus]
MSSYPPEVSSSILHMPSVQNSSSISISIDDQSSPHETTNSVDANATNTTSDRDTKEDNSQFGPKKRHKTSAVCLEFKEVELPDGINSEKDEQFVTPTLTNGKFDMAKMREANAHWIFMHAHPFTIVEEEVFNMMQRRGMLEWEKMSHNTIKKDCVQVYEIEKKKLKSLLKNISKISITTDMWKSTNQKLEYMVLTGHFVDSNWKLQKPVLSFVHLFPPHHGVEIADNFYKCLKDWSIEKKVYTISVDNASNNDSTIKILTDTFSRNKKLLCGGNLFHVRCCAHILKPYGLRWFVKN